MDLYNILIVDDEVVNLNALKRTFRKEYNVFSAISAEDAMSIMEQNDIDLIIADDNVLGITGLELLEKTSQEYPDTIRIILTTRADQKLIIDAIDIGYVHGYITKPWEPEEAKAIIKEWLDNTSQEQKAERKRIGEILVEHYIISKNQLDTALELQRHEEYKGKKLGEILVDLGYADEESIFSCYALQLGMPYIPLSQFHSKPKMAELLPSKLAQRYAIIPVDIVGRVLVLAASEPLSDRAKSEIEEETGYKVMAVCTSHVDIKAALGQNRSDQLPEANLSTAKDDVPMSRVPETE